MHCAGHSCQWRTWFQIHPQFVTFLRLDMIPELCITLWLRICRYFCSPEWLHRCHHFQWFVVISPSQSSTKNVDHRWQVEGVGDFLSAFTTADVSTGLNLSCWGVTGPGSVLGMQLAGLVEGGYMLVCITVLNSCSGWWSFVSEDIIGPTFTDVDSLIRFSGAIAFDEVSSFRLPDQLTDLIGSKSMAPNLFVLADDSVLISSFSTKLLDDPADLKKDCSNDGDPHHNEIKNTFDTWLIAVIHERCMDIWTTSASKMSTSDKTRSSIYDLLRASAWSESSRSQRRTTCRKSLRYFKRYSWSFWNATRQTINRRPLVLQQIRTRSVYGWSSTSCTQCH